MFKRLRYMLLLLVALAGTFPVSGQIAMPDNVCVGAIKNYWVTDTPGSVYTWTINGATQTETSSLITVQWDTPGNYTITVQELSADGCLGDVQSGEVIVSDNLLVSVALLADPNPVCIGESVLFTATATNGGTNPVFSWFVDQGSGFTMMQTGPGNTYTYPPQNGDQVYVMLESDETCATGSPANSEIILMQVDPLLPVTVSIDALPSVICEGTEITLTATSGNGGPNPVFSWFVDRGAGFVQEQSGTDDFYTFIPNGGEIVYVELFSDINCGSGNPAQSSQITIDVTPLLQPSVTIIADNGDVCAGTEVTFTALPVNGGLNPVYEWYVDGGLVAGATTSTYAYFPSNGDQVEAVLISDETCVVPGPVTSNTIVVNVNQPAIVTVGITPENNPVCAGTEVLFTATYSNEGLNPQFQWFLNGNPVGVNQNTYSYTPVDGDEIQLVLLSDAECVSGNPATSNLVMMTVTDEITPTFAAIGPLCLNSTPPALELISLEGITGTWNPAVIATDATGTFTYTFTPDADQCAVETTLDITITDEITPTFSAIGPLCLNSTPPALELISLEGITGAWNPAVIATDATGTFTYTFTPDADQCAIETTLEITISDEITPTFVAIGPLCLNSTPPALELISLEGISGTWTPAMIATDATGTFTYTFIPDADQCAVETTLDITITDEITPTFAAIGPLCLNSAPPALELISLEGITGTWNPAVIATNATGTFTYTFTPDADQCAVETTLEITISDEIIPTFAAIGPLCLNSTPPALELISLEGITGTWNPASINTTVLGPADYVFTPDAGQCGVEITMTIVIDDEIVPEFTQIGPLCLNSAAPTLPTVSNNGITGSWTPSAINTTLLGPSDYVFTPDAGQCGVEITMTIVIDDEIVPEFTQIGPLCLNSAAPTLPTVSNNGISGSWTPSVINTTVLGPADYVFTPDAGQCGVEITMTIVIEDEIVPEFTQIGPLCLNSAAPTLPTTSNNGITGFWTPSVINTTVLGPADYVFTPDAGQCGVEITMTIVIDDEIVPEFTQIGPLCLNSTAPTLPTVSNNGISGTWNPSTINTTVLGSSDYVFTPDAGQCGVEITMTIVIDDEIVPEFTQIGPLCLNSPAPTLPTASNNGISGFWTPAAINTTVLGPADYVFTPDAGQCGVEITMTIVIEDEIVPEFTQIGPLCLNSTSPTLPTVSNNGITGFWTPSVINTTVLGPADYLFSPDAGQCGVEITMTIVIEDEIVPEFTQIGPLCLNSPAPTLPTASNNGITGSWTPSVINTTVLGPADYVFTPDAGQCGLEITMTIVIDDEIVPEFTQIGPLCLNSAAPTLSTVSNNGITGTWNPASINTTVLGPSDYVFTPDAGQCGVELTMTIVIDDEIVPEFTQIGPLCLNSTAPALPTVSNNGITGTWTPSVINTTVLGPSDYVFTPDAGQCGVEITMTIVIEDEIVPEFTQIGPLCLNSTAPTLPTVSNNGISGSWTPSTINTTVLGSSDYVFTPDAGQCGVEITMTIVIDDEIVPEFTQIGPLCLNSTAPTLPTVSNNGITGSWTPASINTTVLGPSDYVFTPDAGQCGVEITMTIVIDDEIVPEFTQIGPLCLNSTAPTLPTVSNNGISGSWTPSTINTTVLGSSDYVFTPDAGQCGVEITMTIVIDDEIVPEFTQIGPLCLNSTAPTLPTSSNNGITGFWTPSVINTTVLGPADYVFTPDAGQCGVEITMTIVIDDEIVPEFTQIGPLCLNSTAPTLPTTSNNGISGTWNPSTINTTVLGPSDYVFTPDAGQCGVEITMTIVIDDEIVPEFTQIGPLCLNSTAPALPTTSNNGITGFWTPSVINTTVLGPADYVFTHDAGLCGVEYTMTIVIDDEIVPEFTQIGPLCLNSTAPTLPTVSNNGITGFWTPSVINTTVLGPSDYVFTPDAGQCGVGITMTIVIDDEIVPEFTQIGPLCLNSPAPTLPTVSNNGITGFWTPAAINTTVLGPADYVFTPDAGQCSVEVVMTVNIDSPVIINIETRPATNGLPNGEARIIASGGLAPLEYSINGIDWYPLNEFNGLAADVYTAYVRDARGCEISQEFTITNSVVAEVLVSAQEVESCLNVPIELPVFSENFIDVVSFTLVLTFDDAMVTYLNLVNVHPLLEAISPPSIELAAGQITIRYSAAPGSVTLPTNAQLFGILFNGMNPGNVNFNWSFDECLILSAEGYEIPKSLVPGSVEILPAPALQVYAGGTFCEGDSTIFRAVNQDAQLLNYVWTRPDGSLFNNRELVLNPLQIGDNGVYNFMATNPEGCSVTETISLVVNPGAFVNISDTDSLCAGTMHFLDAGSGFETYLWQDGSNLQTYTATEAGEYRVEVVNSYGCEGSSSVWLVPCTLELTMPNAFTPNGDRINDVFKPVLLGDITPSRFLMQIYNKWGELVYETSDYSAGWNGFVKGSLAPAGVYAFVINFEVPGYINVTVKSPVRGSVTLLR